MIVAPPPRVDDGRARVRAHAAPSPRVVLRVVLGGAQHAAPSGAGDVGVDAADTLLRSAAHASRYGIVPKLEARQRIAEAVRRGRVENDAAVPVRQDVVVRPHARRASRSAGAPVRHRGVADQEVAAAVAQARSPLGRRLPHAEVVPHIREVPQPRAPGERGALEVLGEERVPVVHPRDQPHRELDEGAHAPVPGHVPAQRAGRIRQPVGEAGALGQHQQPRAPRVARRQHEGPGPEHDLGVRLVVAPRQRGVDPVALLLQLQAAHQGA